MMSNVSLMVCVFSEKKKKGKHEVPEPYRDNSNTEVVGSSSCTEYSCTVVAVLIKVISIRLVCPTDTAQLCDDGLF